MPRLVVGLGNFTHPGTRHNAGMLFLDHLCSSYDRTLGGWLGERVLENTRLLLYKPREYMNLNGIPVAKAMRALSVSPGEICVVHDDIDRPLGRVSLKLGGSANGHNGIKSLVNALGTSEFARIRIGVGRPLHKSNVSTYVLSAFEMDELDILQKSVYPTVESLLMKMIQEGR